MIHGVLAQHRNQLTSPPKPHNSKFYHFNERILEIVRIADDGVCCIVYTASRSVHVHMIEHGAHVS